MNHVVDGKCYFCGEAAHGARCPFVRAIEYFSSGKIKRVEFVSPQPLAPLTPSIPWDWSRPFPAPALTPTD